MFRNIIVVTVLLVINGCSEHPAAEVARQACEAIKTGDRELLHSLAAVQLAGKVDDDYLLLGSKFLKPEVRKRLSCEIIRVKKLQEGEVEVWIRNLKPMHLKEESGAWHITGSE